MGTDFKTAQTGSTSCFIVVVVVVVVVVVIVAVIVVTAVIVIAFCSSRHYVCLKESNFGSQNVCSPCCKTLHNKQTLLDKYKNIFSCCKLKCLISNVL